MEFYLQAKGVLVARHAAKGQKSPPKNQLDYLTNVRFISVMAWHPSFTPPRGLTHPNRTPWIRFEMR